LPRLSTAFQSLERNLILESTRGEKEQYIFRQCAPTVVLVVTKDGLGSGVVIDNMGHVVTNHHVVTPHSTVAVVFKPRNGQDLTKDLARKAIVEKIDPIADLALLRIENPPHPISIAAFGDSSALEVGMDVHSIGHPLGEIWTYSRGTISALRNNYEDTIGGQLFRANVIQHQTPINPGNSGGPLLIDACLFVGINTFTKGREGLNFAVSVDTIRRFLEAPAPQVTSRPENPRLSCPRSEQYDLGHLGWGLIGGCYLEVQSPPPNWWLVRRGAESESYVVADLDHNGYLETAMVRNKERGGYLWATDSDCDGIVDAVGHQPEGSQDITTYSQPQERIVLKEIVREMDYALRVKAIPHSTLKVCQ
jgi:hypothetical protein